MGKLRLSCETQKTKMKARLKVLKGDLEVLTDILKLTDCDANSFLQTTSVAVLKCLDPCTKKMFFSFNHDALRKDMSQLQSPASHDLAHESLSELFNGIDGMKKAELLQSESDYSPVINKTRWQNPPVPRTEIPADPCTDPDAGAPSANDKRSAKCILGPGQCKISTERFLLV